MKISERCKKQIEDIERIANEFKVKGKCEPYDVVLWNRDLESISELYIAYKLLEAENNELNEIMTGLHKECRSLHNTINILRADNSNQSHEIHKLKTENERLKENFNEHLNALEAENHDLKDKLFTKDEEIRKLYEKVGELHTIKKSFEVLRALYLGDYENDEPF